MEAPKEPIEAKVYFMPDLTIPLELQSKIGFVYLCNETSTEPYESFKLQILDKMLFEGP